MLESLMATLLGKNLNEPFVSVDIGTSAIKVMSIDFNSGAKPKVLSVGSVATPADAVSNNTVTKPSQIGAAIRSVLDANEISAKKATVAIPGPSVFTKKITTASSTPKELDGNIMFEAGNYIPHSLSAVHLDYQVMESGTESTIDVLLVAVKNEIIESYTSALIEAGLEPAIADVDYFALENMFETNYPEENGRVIALVNVGARYTSVSIVKDGESLFSGDIGVGGRLYTDALCETLGMEPALAEQAKMGADAGGHDRSVVEETLVHTTEHIASEIHRQLGFFWNAAATDEAIEAVYLCGGGAKTSGLLKELSDRTGIECKMIEPFRGLVCSKDLDESYLDDLKLSMAVSVGLAMRRFGDKNNATAK